MANPPPVKKSWLARSFTALRRARLSTKLIIGVAVIVLIAAISVGAYYISGAQERAYNKGHASYLEGDCATAIGPLGEAAGDDTHADITAKAQVELEECQALLAADALDTQGKPGDAVLSYSAFVTNYPTSPIIQVALTRGQALIAEGPPERIGTVPLCSALDTLESQRFVATPDEVLPPLLLACGQAYESAGDLASALAMLERIRSEHPDTPLMAAVDETYVRVSLADAAASGAGELASPDAVGAPAAGGPAVVVILNASTERLTVVFSGAERHVQELPACTECKGVDIKATGRCPESLPQGRYELPPGSYDVVVRTMGGADVRPFRGTWVLNAGQTYANCFYIAPL